MISAPAMTAVRTTAAAALTAMLGLGAGCWVVSVWQMNGAATRWLRSSRTMREIERSQHK